MFCQRCGNTLAPGARFCNNCGTPVTAPQPAVSLVRPPLITIIAVVHFVAATFLLIAGGALLVTAFTGKAAEGPTAFGFGVFFLLSGGASLAAGIGLWKMREWGRILQIVLASIGLIGIPLGTVISVLLLVYFTRPHVKILFSGKRLDQLTADEHAMLAQHAAGGAGSTVAVVVVVAFGAIMVLGILAAIAIPNLLSAMQRAKQKRTIADMHTIAAKVDSYREANNNALPQAQSMPELAAALHLTTQTDGWGHQLRYVSDGTNYWLISAGKDAAFEAQAPQQYQERATTNFDADIVLQNGAMLQEPQGLQR